MITKAKRICTNCKKMCEPNETICRECGHVTIKKVVAKGGRNGKTKPTLGE